MRRAAFLRSLLTVALALAACLAARSSNPSDPLVILVSIDGFRWDYLDVHKPPVLRRLAREGVRARRMTPAFPSKTFPNHYTIVTGLHPGHHGLVGNWFYDPSDNEKFEMRRTESRWFQGGEPVWITAEKQGVRAGCFFWPGSESEIQGRRASFSRPFDKKLTNAQRVDGLLAYLDAPEEKRPRLLTLYFDNVDDAGHWFGPTAPETTAAVLDADAAIGRLLAGLGQRGLAGQANLVIVSDHGMSPSPTDKVVFFEDLMDVSRVRIEATGPVGGVRPLPGGPTPAELVAGIRARAPRQVRAYLREETPARFHYRDDEKIPPVVLICDDQWNVETKAGWPQRARTYNVATHGWDPRTRNMGALFLAHGPLVRRGAVVGDFENVHVYPLLCRMLGITPAPSDGDDRLVRRVLR